jgi:hypothetical protein
MGMVTMRRCDVIETAPPAFYRVQHAELFIQFEEEGFFSKVTSPIGYSYWVDKSRFESYLDWKARPGEFTPDISQLDDLEDAKRRKVFHEKQGCHDVFIAKI